MVFFSVLINISFHKLFCPVPNLNWYAARLNPVHIMTEVMIWSRELNVDLQVSFNLSLQQFYLLSIII